MAPKPWKFFLLGQFFLIPSLACVLCEAFPEPDRCNNVEEVCRASLFLIGTFPPIPWVAWFVAAFKGNPNQAFVYVLLSYLLCPLSQWFWLRQVGESIDREVAETLEIPFMPLLTHFGIMILPTAMVMAVRTKFPDPVERLSDGFVSLAIFCVINVIFALWEFCDQSEHELCLKRQLTLCFVLGFGGAFFSTILTLAFGLPRLDFMPQNTI